jgi:hypothetical protein
MRLPLWDRFACAVFESCSNVANNESHGLARRLVLYLIYIMVVLGQLAASFIGIVPFCFQKRLH